MLSTLAKAAFTENVNTVFRAVMQDSTVVEMELIEVKEGRSTPKQEQFSLIFRAPEQAQVAQGMYRLEHDHLEAGDLFLVPLGLDDNGLYYQATFNRLLE